MTDENTQMNDEDYLEFGQRLRHDIVTNLTTDSSGLKRLPIDTETLTVIKGMLKDSDSSVFTKRRVMVDEASVENDKRAADIVEATLNRLTRHKRDPEKLVGSGPVIDENLLPKFDIESGATSEVGDSVDFKRHELCHIPL